MNITQDSNASSRTHLVLTGCLFIRMILVDEKMVGENIERYAREVHLKQTSSFIPAIPNKAFIAPMGVHNLGQEIEQTYYHKPCLPRRTVFLEDHIGLVCRLILCDFVDFAWRSSVKSLVVRAVVSRSPRAVKHINASGPDHCQKRLTKTKKGSQLGPR